MTNVNLCLTQEEHKFYEEYEKDFKVVEQDVTNIPWYRCGHANVSNLFHLIQKVSQEFEKEHTEDFKNFFQKELDGLEDILEMRKKYSCWYSCSMTCLDFLILCIESVQSCTNKLRFRNRLDKND
jgi:hypothetical protein